MTGENDIWDEKPPLLRNAGTIEVGVNPKFLDWLENLKAKITQLNECLGEYESKEWCDHCIIDSKCAQITLHVQELKEKAKKWDRLDQPAKYNLTKYMECSDKLEAVKTWYLAHELLPVTPKNFDECARARYTHFDKLKEILEAKE